MRVAMLCQQLLCERAMPSDHSLAFRRDPYGFISKLCRRLGADVFQMRLLFRDTLCMTGRAAAQLFYDGERFCRHGAAPEPLQKTLLGVGGVQSLDGEQHRRRKAMFLSLMTAERVRELAEIFRGELLKEVSLWQRQDRVTLYEAVQPVLTRSVCQWSGVPLPARAVGRRTRELTAMFDAAGRFGPAQLWSRLARRRAERWAAHLIKDVRAGRLTPPAQTALHVISLHRDLDGGLLPPGIAAVELLNVLRPTVAVSVYIVFCAHALHQYPASALSVRSGDENYLHAFIQEVRRYYPFFPAVPARVRQNFRWQGQEFRKGRRAMLDLHGTNHDARLWPDPGTFKPSRFIGRRDDDYDFLPQGGGTHELHHRCPGEWITMALMRVAVEFLTQEIDYRVPRQDLRLTVTRLPALPRSRLVISEIRARLPAAADPPESFSPRPIQ